jgi:hypothetical protein
LRSQSAKPTAQVPTRHTPDVHTVAATLVSINALQFAPHSPQFAVSVLRSVQMAFASFPQRFCPEGQIRSHRGMLVAPVLAMQSNPSRQAFPQTPQCSREVRRSTQSPPALHGVQASAIPAS